MARKYRQRGYQDEPDRPPRGEGGGGPQRDRKEGPRGRGLGAPTAWRFQCARCGAEVRTEGAVSVDATCGGCSADLHTCTNCRFFDPAARFECRAEIEQRVARKAARNDCALFEPKSAKVFAPEGGRDDDPRAAFDALFKI